MDSRSIIKSIFFVLSADNKKGIQIEFNENEISKSKDFYQECLQSMLPVENREVFDTSGIWLKARLLQYTCYGDAFVLDQFLTIAKKFEPEDSSLFKCLPGNNWVVVDPKSGFSLNY